MEANVCAAFRLGADDPLLLDDNDPVSFIQASGSPHNQLGTTSSSALEAPSEFLMDDNPSTDVFDYLKSPSPTFQSSHSQQN